MTVVSGEGIDSVADELEALRVRVENAKVGAEARAQAVAAETRQIQTTPATPHSPARATDWRPSRGNLIVALVLLLIGAGVTMIVNRGDGSGNRVSNAPAVADGPARTDRPSTDLAAGASATSPASPAAPDLDTQDTGSPTSSALPSSPPGITSDTASTVVVVVGDTFWSIAEHQVALARGAAPSTAEVAGYWGQLVEINQSRLAHSGNPDLIYAGQTFSLP